MQITERLVKRLVDYAASRDSSVNKVDISLALKGATVKSNLETIQKTMTENNVSYHRPDEIIVSENRDYKLWILAENHKLTWGLQRI